MTAFIKTDDSHTRNRDWFVQSRRFLQFTGLATALLTSTGCVTSPYWHQSFESKEALVPIQTWTTNRTDQVTIECALATRGSSYPYGGEATWHVVTTGHPNPTPSYDSFGAKVFSFSTQRQIPEQCWRPVDSFGYYYTAIRATQDSRNFHTFDKDGLECLGRENGKAASVTGYLGKGCNAQYNYLVVKAPLYPSS